MSAASTRVYGNSQVSKIHRVHPSSLFPPWYLRYRPTRGSLRRNEDPTGADGAATNGSPNSFANPWIAVGLATELAGIQNVPGAHGSGGAARRCTSPPASRIRVTARKLSFHVGVSNQPDDPDPVTSPAILGGSVRGSILAASFSVTGRTSTPMSWARLTDAQSLGARGVPSARRVQGLSG